MEDKDYIKELFQEKLKNHEVQVNPDLWSAISSNIGTTSSVVSSGLSSAWKWFIGVTSVASVTTVSVILLNNKPDEKTPVKPVKTEISEAKSSEQSSDSQQTDNVPAGNQSTPLSLIQKDQEQVKKINFVIPEVHEEDEQFVLSETYGDRVNSTVGTLVNPEVKETAKEEGLASKGSGEGITATNTEAVAQKELFIGKLPTIFTPNNDNDNDFFIIELRGITDFSIIVLNDKNEKVFFSDDLNFKWDGKDLGENPVPEGSYVYFFTGKDSQNKLISKSNTLKVVRNPR